MSAPYLLFDHEKIGKRTITNQGCVIGRGEDCHIRIAHKGVSSRHAEIVKHNGQYWIRDLGSTNGTHVDGSRCTDQFPLNNGARVKLGRFSATFVAPEPARVEAPAQTVEQRVAAGNSGRRRPKQASMNPLWAAVALVATAGLTLFVVDRMRSSEDSSVVDEQPLEIGKRTGKQSRDPDSPFSALGKLDDNPVEEDDDTPSGANESAKPDPTRKKEPRKVPENPHRDTRNTETPRADREPAPTEDPLELALRSGNALEIAKIVRRKKGDRAAAIRSRLEDEPIYALHRSGLLGGGEEILLSAFGFHCAPDDTTEIIELVPGCRIEEWKLSLRFTQDYSKGLGRTMGKYRMPPHPKKVTVELTPINAPGKAWTVEVETPALELTDEGYTEEQVWAMTLDPLLAQLQKQLQ